MLLSNNVHSLYFQIVATGDRNSSERVYYVENFRDLDEIVSQLVTEIESARLEGTVLKSSLRRVDVALAFSIKLQPKVSKKTA